VSVVAPTVADMSTTPEVIARYYAAATSGDVEGLLACFTPDAHVRDDGQDYHGIAQIRGWREALASRFTYTAEITGVEQADEGVHVVGTHLEGDFPGGVVDLQQRFILADGLITDLAI
jgi:ketosteroid isomerase-like protein